MFLEPSKTGKGTTCSRAVKQEQSPRLQAPEVLPFARGANQFATVRLGITLAAILIASPFLAAQKVSIPNVTADLPPGPMQAKATTVCMECHEARIILQQRLSKAAWTKEVDKMIKWGAVVDSADRDALIDYLSTNFSPDKPAYEPQRTAGGKAAK